MDDYVPYEELRSKVTDEIPLEMLFRDEKKYADVQIIIQKMLEKMEDWFGSDEFPSTFAHGDQLTVEKLAGLIRLMKEARQDYTKINPGITDWHARQALADVCMFVCLGGWLVGAKISNLHKELVQ